MPLPGYGLLIGTVEGSRPQAGKNPHWLLMVQPGKKDHPAYRVAVNLQSGVAAGEMQYLDIDINAKGSKALKSLAAELNKRGATDYFLRASGDAKLPRLDFVHGGLFDPTTFRAVGSKDAFRAALEKALKEAKKEGALVAVFGTGTPVDPKTQRSVATGYTGVENIHMNQGTFHSTGGTDHYLENGPMQDGGLIFLLSSGPRALFVKFHTQTVQTDEEGNPAISGVKELDNTPAHVNAAIAAAGQKAVAQNKAVKATRAAGATKTAARAGAKSGFVFADMNQSDADETFVADDDAGNFNTPFVVKFSHGSTKGPVPGPRNGAYPTMNLADVMGDAPPGYSKGADGETLVFDLAGDSGAPAEKKLPGEHRVTELMAQNAQEVPPAFLFHLGDVVYFYGEQDYYYSQFYEPFRTYPAPIFAIPGNHDGIIYNDKMTSLDAFQKAFCAAEPARWQGAGGILRTTMTQPGVYFTLDAPLVSIIGLYSNCGESLGWLDAPQLQFLYNELVRLKKARAQDGRAVLLAIHHCPRWFPGAAKADPTSAAIDAACKKADFWPDAVLCGHAHLYQRVVREVAGKQIPYLIIGCSGYGLNAMQETAKNYVTTLSPQMQALFIEEGYVRATVSKPGGRKAATVRFEFMSTKAEAGRARDTCTVDLSTGQLA